MSVRFRPLYHERPAKGRRGRLRHLFRAEGIGISSVCADAQFTAAVGNPAVIYPRCPECRLVAITEIALAADELGLVDVAVAAAGAARSASFETSAAQTTAATA